MCFGGGGSRATITMPDTRAYDRMFDMQKSAIESQMNSGLQLKQQELQSTLKNQEKLHQQSLDLKQQLANDTSAQAARMAALIGAPPPEKTATAPVTGNARTGATRKGKSGLRIERQTASSAGVGAGLNIT